MCSSMRSNHQQVTRPSAPGIGRYMVWPPFIKGSKDQSLLPTQLDNSEYFVKDKGFLLWSSRRDRGKWSRAYVLVHVRHLVTAPHLWFLTRPVMLMSVSDKRASGLGLTLSCAYEGGAHREGTTATDVVYFSTARTVKGLQI